MKNLNHINELQHKITISSHDMADICGLNHQIVLDDISFMFNMLDRHPLPYYQCNRDNTGKKRCEYVLPLSLAMYWACGYDRRYSDQLIRYLLMKDDAPNSCLLLELWDDVTTLKAQYELLNDELQRSTK